MTSAGRATPPADAVSVEIDVPLHDVDPLGIVWHGNYFKYMDTARAALFRARDFDIGAMAEHGLRMMVVDARCRYAAPLRYADRVRTSAWIASIDNRVHVAYRIYNETSESVAATAFTVLVTTDAEGKLLWSTPEVVREHLSPRA